jgi:hypothetical protein
MDIPPQILSSSKGSQAATTLSAPPSITTADVPPMLEGFPKVKSANDNTPRLSAANPPSSQQPPGKMSLGKACIPWRSATLILLAIALAVFAAAAWNQLNRHDTPEDYAALCECLFNSIPVRGTPTQKPTDAEAQLIFAKLLATLHHVSASSRTMAPIARDYVQDLEYLHQVAHEEVAPSKILFGTIGAALGAYTAQRQMIADSGKEALTETQRLWNKYQNIERFVQRRQVRALQLVELLPKFSAPQATKPLLGCSLTQFKPGFFDFELDKWFLVVTNISGGDLHNCVIRVRLSDSNGESVLQHYFIRTWASNETRTAEYSTGDYPKSTVPDVDRVAVTVWSSESSLAPTILSKPPSGWPLPE